MHVIYSFFLQNCISKKHKVCLCLHSLTHSLKKPLLTTYYGLHNKMKIWSSQKDLMVLVGEGRGVATERENYRLLTCNALC